MKITLPTFFVLSISSFQLTTPFSPTTQLPSIHSFAGAHGGSLRKSRNTRPKRGLTIVHSSKMLPFAYASASLILLMRATKAVSKVDQAVLVSTSALALFNLGPTDNKRFASAKKAYANTPPASSGKDKQRRQAARTWRSVVRIKLIGQLVGLLWMAFAKQSEGVMKGASTVMVANMAFFLCGAGPAMHNQGGESAPMPSSLSRTVLTIDTILAVSAYISSTSPVESVWRAIFAGVFATGASIGALEGVASMVSKRSES